MISARMNALSGVTSLGLSTTVQPGRQRRGDLGDDLVQRVVPRRDGADHADRLAHHQRVAHLLLERELVEDLHVAGHVPGRQAGLDHVGPHERHARARRRWSGRSPRCGRRGPRRWPGRTCPAPRATVWPQVSNAALAAATARSTSAGVPGRHRGDDLLGRRVDDLDGVGARRRAPRRRRCRACRTSVTEDPPGAVGGSTSYRLEAGSPREIGATRPPGDAERSGRVASPAHPIAIIS